MEKRYNLLFLLWILGLVQVTMIIFKLMGYLNLSWLVIFIPSLVEVALLTIIMLVITFLVIKEKKSIDKIQL